MDGFESGVVPESGFHHADHVRLAFAYLRKFPVLPALEKFSSALKQFATRHGKTQLYNATITHAYFFLIREPMDSRQSFLSDSHRGEPASRQSCKAALFRQHRRKYLYFTSCLSRNFQRNHLVGSKN